MTLTVGSLFSGIGGLDLGLERAGMTVIWQSEIDAYACRVLAKHWPHVPNHGDIAAIDWSTVESPDVICGGYPCQPFSLAGVRRGDTDPRHLWPHFHRAIRHLRPRYALLENVPGHLSLGFGDVLGDLAEIGYDVEWCSIPAAAVGAPHLRWRLFAVATDADRGELRLDGWGGSSEPARRDVSAIARLDGSTRHVAGDKVVTLGTGLRPHEPGGERGRRPGDGRGSDRTSAHANGAGLEERRTGRTTDNGDHWAVEPDVGRVADGVPHRMDRLKCLGNAVVPQVAEWIGRRIMEAAA